ncbi:hypothetical protein VQ042_06020 [Aurantimonas sp. A2-1-M11]|uniref:hypothetical protein n=1 Tax=Aurantimonas sp. A2-1-M11 TaxID=3113712 RepID=UPI002F92F572
MLAAIAAAIRAAASAAAAAAAHWCWWAVTWTWSLPGRLLGGGGGGSLPHPPAAPPMPDTAREIAAMVATRGRGRALPGALPSALDPSPDGTDPISATVHAYARAAPSDRRQVSLEALSPDQVSWLLRLRPEDLQRLAAAGGLVCGRLARGVAGGALGVPACRRREPDVERHKPEAEDPDTFAARIRRQRGGLRLVM